MPPGARRATPRRVCKQCRLFSGRNIIFKSFRYIILYRGFLEFYRDDNFHYEIFILDPQRTEECALVLWDWLGIYDFWYICMFFLPGYEFPIIIILFRSSTSGMISRKNQKKTDCMQPRLYFWQYLSYRDYLIDQ